MCDPFSLGAGAILKNQRDKKKDRKAELKMYREADAMRVPLEKPKAPKQQTKINTGVNIGGKY